ncbi:3'-5' exonuclease family protein [Spirosoma taeanense]|uniref:hypothetical protein n=1 Tax=Spirosoma taeanense TaxID=2735870 RepID=UPI001F035F5E|nr:hypothetical protein [Spirosoma taeanense]
MPPSVSWKRRLKNFLFIDVKKEFGYLYLCRRLMVNGLPLPPALQISGKKPWEVTHQDTLEHGQFSDKRHFVSLDLLAATLNVPTCPLE